MIVAVASDHRGFKLKKQILEKRPFLDYGTDSEKSTDYPIYAFKIGESIKNKQIDRGILICGSGIGMSIACNKVKGVRCARVTNKEEVMSTRRDNDANVISFSENISLDDALEMIDTFLQTNFNMEEKYTRRLNQILDYEDKNA